MFLLILFAGKPKGIPFEVPESQRFQRYSTAAAEWCPVTAGIFVVCPNFDLESRATR